MVLKDLVLCPIALGFRHPARLGTRESRDPSAHTVRGEELHVQAVEWTRVRIHADRVRCGRGGLALLVALALPRTWAPVTRRPSTRPTAWHRSGARWRTAATCRLRRHAVPEQRGIGFNEQAGKYWNWVSGTPGATYNVGVVSGTTAPDLTVSWPSNNVGSRTARPIRSRCSSVERARDSQRRPVFHLVAEHTGAGGHPGTSGPRVSPSQA